jgi:hypothetical protein
VKRNAKSKAVKNNKRLINIFYEDDRNESLCFERGGIEKRGSKHWVNNWTEKGN